jgi:flagellar biosynthesis/type III secretory pathway protein FliH
MTGVSSFTMPDVEDAELHEQYEIGHENGWREGYDQGYREGREEMIACLEQAASAFVRKLLSELIECIMRIHKK